MNSIKVCEYSRSRSFHDDLILQDQASGERSQDHWSSGFDSTAFLVDPGQAATTENSIPLHLSDRRHRDPFQIFAEGPD